MVDVVDCDGYGGCVFSEHHMGSMFKEMSSNYVETPKFLIAISNLLQRCRAAPIRVTNSSSHCSFVVGHAF